MSNVLVAGSTGYVGGRLVPELLDAGHTVRCIVRDPAKLGDAPWRADIDIVHGDVTEQSSVDAALEDIDIVYYLVHSMTGSENFEALDRTAAACVARAAQHRGTRRIVYLGGLGDDDDPNLSRHLRSRHEVGRVLASGSTPVTELRAAVIIGSGSASFEMLRYLVEVLPVMVAPKWVSSLCQPIAIHDVLAALVVAVDDTEHGHHIVEIGGPDVLSYRDMMQTYSDVAGLTRRVVVRVPLLTPKLSSLWISLVTPLPANLARPLVDSLVMDVTVHQRPPPPFPEPAGAMPFRRAVELALERSASFQVATRWSDASLPGRTPADPMPTDAEWAGGSVLVDEQIVETDAAPAAVFRTVSGIGGERGWYVTPLLWEARGWIDKLIGGVGMRRGRRHPDDLWIGDAVDFWRVEAVEPDQLVRFRAEMRLPGEAWIEWGIRATECGSVLEQRAIFAPKGLWGRAYWYALLPFHALIFGRLASRLAAAASTSARTPMKRPGP